MKNYTLIKEEYLPDIKETGKLYVHNKTGARVVSIKSSDPNKVFCIAFKTLPNSSNGVCHILEHSVLCGSKKYPVKDPFAILSKTSLNTYLNAFTASDMTVYPVASLNKKDFYNLMDVYLDAVFNPLIYENKEIFLEEGWRFEFDEINNKLNVNGVVFNEMKGQTSSIDYFVSQKIEEELYKGSIYSYESGGSPSEIPNLSYEEFLDFHKKNYHPSNAYIFLYGDFDMEERLSYLDNEYLSKYEKITLNNDLENTINYLPRKIFLNYEPYEDDLDSSIFTYNVAFSNNLDIEKCCAVSLIVDDLNSENSRLHQRMLEENICENFEINYYSSNYEPYISFVGKGAKKKNEQLFYNVIDEELNYIVSNGIDVKNYESIIKIIDFKTRENYFGSFPRGIEYFSVMLNTLIHDDSKVFSAFDYLSLENKILENINDNYFENYIKDIFINNNHKVLITFNPLQGVKKQEDEKFNEFLDNKLKSFTKENLDNLMRESFLLQQYMNKPDSKENLSKMPKLTLDDIDPKPICYNIRKINDFIYHSNYDTNHIVYKKYLFDLSKFSNIELQYIKLFCTLLMLVDTSDYTYKDLDVLENNYSGGINTKIVCYEKDKKYFTYFELNASYLINNSHNVNEIIESVLLRSKFDSKKRVKQLINEIYDDIKEKISRKGNTYALRRVLSYTVESEAFNELLFGISYFNFIANIKNNFDLEYEKIVEFMNDLPQKLFVKDSLLSNFTGTTSEFELDYKETLKFYELLNDTYKSNNKFIFEKNIKNEAFIIKSNVNYVAMGGFYIEPFMKESYLLNNYISMEYLWNKVRIEGGAYGVALNIDDSYVCFNSYRDPNIKNTLETFKNTAKYVKNLDIDKETLDHIKITTIGSNNEAMHNKMLADIAFRKAILGITYAETLNTRKLLISASKDDLKACYKIIDDALNNNAYCVIGNEKEIHKNKDLFKNIIKLL